MATGRTACDDDGDIDWGTYNDFDWGGGEWDWYGSGISSSGGGGSPCNWFTSTATGGLIIDCGNEGVYAHMRTECIGDPGIGGGGGSGGPGGGTTDTDGEPNGPVGVLPPTIQSIMEDMIENEQDPDQRRIIELNYIGSFNGTEGNDFRVEIESILGAPPGLSREEKDAINEVVHNYYLQLKGQYFFAIFGTVAEAAKPWIELALIETGTGVLFQAVKGILSVRWGIQLAKLGVNTVSITTVTNRMVNGLKFGLNNNSLNLKIGGRNLFGSANSSKTAYSFNGVSTSEAEAIFADVAAGRKVKTITAPKGLIKRVGLEGKDYVQFRKWSETNAGEATIEFYVSGIRTKKIELKFFP